MKKVLFCMESLRAGGSATSLINLLCLYKEQGITCDLFLLEHDGIFLDQGKQYANVLPEEPIISSIRCSKERLKKRGFLAFCIRATYIAAYKLLGVDKANRLFYSRSAAKLSNKYDTVVAYQEQIPTEYLQYVKADRRIAWCHSNFDAFCGGKPVEYYQNIYAKYNEVVCVSDVICQAMIETVELDLTHVHRIYNTIPPKPICEKANVPVEMKEAEHRFVSVGRFVDVKGFDRAVLAAAALREQGISFVWYILGDGPEFKNIERMVRENDLTDYVILTGMTKNPFPYMAGADAYVMASSNEAQPMVMNEALTLQVPVISTLFPSAAEVVTDGVNGILTENSTDGVLQGVLRFINDESLRKDIKRGAQEFVYDNEKILRKIDELL